MGFSTTIIRFYIKSGSGLTENNMNPKMLDFKLARLFPEDTSHVCQHMSCWNLVIYQFNNQYHTVKIY